MSSGSIRRAQLVSPFGVGAMSVLVNGTSVITAGLDHWFATDDSSDLQLDEYVALDWRLQRRLQVREFRLPPDYRRRKKDFDQRNTNLKVPALRFPRWAFCMYCKRLEKSPLSMTQPVACPDPGHTAETATKRKPPRMAQVPFVAICSAGHLDDFPFREWVHKSSSTTCIGTLRLESRGGGGLDGQVVVCDGNATPKGCGAERSLEGIMGSHLDGLVEHTYLTDHLDAAKELFYCTGARPWLGEADGFCSEPIRGALRAAGNVYFPKVESSIYLPRKIGAVSAEVHELLKRLDVSPVLRVLNRMRGADVTVQEIRDEVPEELFAPIKDDELLAGYKDMFGVDLDTSVPNSLVDTKGAGDATPLDPENLTGNEEWRYPEYRLLRETPVDDYLTSTNPGIDVNLTDLLDRIRSVETLRETRVLRGFTRVRDAGLKLTTGKTLLRRHPLAVARDWLPAYVVKGEGIYFELKEERLSEWENRRSVTERVGALNERFGEVARHRGLEDRPITPRLVLLHTFAHLVINELIFTCGYSSASLRERLYVSTTPDRKMAGLLIYTAAGDSEGTMGGLVRMAKPAKLWSVVANSIAKAAWCSTDPVCMDLGESGQGPDSCNLAACHGCALLPETSCEEFNRFLDRALILGTFTDPDIGYFTGLGQ
ncbi:hypothetical protein CH305_17120 [Rhodococcus sp. 15-649-2-2]|uniref:DUF1998 domain-containing protein n=1 Tax=Rhodococcus sp. 15-649-2-2 TaxID=2023140 RepID=UPI000B9A7F33|nr:DUF1998 domain-containing protein [Rhodococcus sp. 15-649-2-2]OZE78258.1 hypothetical protein CH305_17120 [Rhodococcus sp. 15-649-2-2]